MHIVGAIESSRDNAAALFRINADSSTTPVYSLNHISVPMEGGTALVPGMSSSLSLGGPHYGEERVGALCAVCMMAGGIEGHSLFPHPVLGQTMSIRLPYSKEFPIPVVIARGNNCV